MIILKGLYDSSNKRLMIDYSCSLLREHYETFEGIVRGRKKTGKLPPDMELQKLEEGRCLMIVPLDLPGTEKLEEGDRVTGIPKDLLEKITTALDEFRDKALRKELGTTEFIPLTGYPLESLKTDIIEAIKNHRNFCLIDNYGNYQKFSRHEITKIQQHKVKYSSDDYSEIALYIYEGDLKGLRGKYASCLTENDWDV